MAKTLAYAELVRDGEKAPWWDAVLEEKVCVIMVGPQDIGTKENWEELCKEASASILMRIPAMIPSEG